MVYHITQNDNIERCVGSKCIIHKKLHFNGLSNALKFLDRNLDIMTLRTSKKVGIKRYDGEINYHSGVTTHYKENRVFREKALVDLLGEGSKLKVFIVEEDSNKQIQELLDNAILVIYSFYTHRKITLFAPNPERIISLYASIGEFPPDWLIEKSECNARKGLNNIYFE